VGVGWTRLGEGVGRIKAKNTALMHFEVNGGNNDELQVLFLLHTILYSKDFYFSQIFIRNILKHMWYMSAHLV
jgi:hypothetical protein